jgi:hypothetical protein
MPDRIFRKMTTYRNYIIIAIEENMVAFGFMTNR